MADVRTDYMPLEEFKHRAIQAIRRGDQPLPAKVIEIEVAFSSFDTFVHDVAFGLRHEVVYRSDGGHFARGFVQASGDLAGIHEVLRKSETRPGAQIRLTALFFRRNHADPTKRWAMSVRFLPRTITVDPDEEDIIHARDDVMADLEKSLAQRVLDSVTTAVEGSAWNPPNRWGSDRVKRIRDWISLAYRVGYPAYLNLWYYDRRAAWWYCRWETKDSERARMVAGTGGKMPFNGGTGGVSGQWRHYPFKDAIAACRRADPDDCVAKAGNIMRIAESDIFQTISDLNHEVHRLAAVANLGDPKSMLHPVSSMKGATSDLTGPTVDAFLKHFKTLLDDQTTLYAPYMRYEQSYMTFWQ
jgi:hypothetical protein